MKGSVKSISSPGRAEKYPPPLMRFLRSNVGSKSRGRSRASPMFVRKKNTAIETQEPTSPKVTCMGQVRVNRSTSRPAGAPKKRRCKWIRNTLFFHRQHKTESSCTPVWRKWVSFFRCGFRRKSKIREDSPKTEQKPGYKSVEEEHKSIDEDVEENDEESGCRFAKVFVSSSSTPPRNALLLTRSRSAPYRSSSLAGRFWGSPLNTEEEEEDEVKTQKTETRNRDETDIENPTSSSRDSVQNSRNHDAENGSEVSNSILENEFAGKNEERKTECSSPPLRPPSLIRCKSEPARSGEKLDPEISYWKKRRLGFT